MSMTFNLVSDMKKFGLLSQFVLLSFAIVGCNKEEFVQNNGGHNSVNVTITTASGETKTGISQDPGNASLYIPSWLGNEKMGVWIDNVPASGESQPDFLTNDEAGEIATFKGSLDMTAGSHTIYGYASSADKYVNRYYAGGVGFDIPQIQYPTLTSFDSDADLLISKPQVVEITEGQTDLSVDNMQFSRALGVLKVVLKDNSEKLGEDAVVKTITLTPSDVENEPLTGRANIDVANGGIISRFNTQNNVRAEYTDDSFVINGENAAWFVVNPLTFSENSTLTLEVEAGKYTISKTLEVGGIELKRGDVTVFNVSLSDENVTVVEAGLALPFVEDFSEASSGSMANANTPWSNSSQFDITGSVYQAGKAIRLGTGSAIGTITTKSALDLSQPFTVKVSGTGWNSSERTMEIIAGNQSKEITFASDKSGEQYEEQVVAFDAETSITKVSFRNKSGERVLVDNIEIYSGTPEATITTVETSDATNVRENSSVLNGSYKAAFIGESDVVKCGFEWGTDATSLTSVTATDAIDGNFSYELSDLTTGETYIFKAWAQLNDGEKIYGEEKTFVPSVPAYYQKVSTITSGKQYLIVAENNGSYYAAEPVTSNPFGYLYVNEVDVLDGNIIYASDVASDENSFVISGAEGSYTICQSDGRYLYQTGTYNNFNLNASPSSGQYWNIEVQADGTMKITNNSVNKYIQYSIDYNSFGSYSGEQGIMPYLFEKVE